MKIKTLILKQFKRFHDLTINLGNNPKKIIALVGPNGCGKSSVFDAFEEKLKDYKGARTNYPASYFSKRWFLEGDEKSETYQKNEAVNIIREDGKTVFDKKSFYIRSSYRFTPKLLVQQIKQQPDILDDSNRPGSSIDLDSRLQENYERLLGQTFYEWQHGDKSGKTVRKELLGKINEILEDILEIKISNLGDVIGGKGQLYFEKGNSKDFPYDNLSSGEKEVIDLIVDLLVKTKDYNDTIFGIDEPELHLNTAIQRKLLMEIEKLIPDNCQLWIATHSLGFLRALQAELSDKTSIIDLSEHNLDEEVKVFPLKSNRENWQRIFETALDDLTGLIAPKYIVYCEGRKDPDGGGNDQGLDAEVYNTIFASKYPNTLFVSSGGNTEPDKYAAIALKVLNKAFSECKLFLLKDKDINSDKSITTDQQRINWLDEDNMRRMLNRKEIENYLFDIEVLCRFHEYLDVDEYYKLIQDIYNGDMKETTGQLMDFLGIKTGMNKEDLKKQLARLITPEMDIFKELEDAIFPLE
ncbi:MAG: ATP-binding protein [Thermotogota bacterium]|nr:ATP-binding protein [Thermotogota bacterium]